MAKKSIDRKSNNNFTKDGKAKMFVVGKYLAEQIDWSRFTYREIIAIANLFANINPNANEIKPVIMTAREFADNCGFGNNFGIDKALSLLLSAKSKALQIAAPADYNPSKEQKEESERQKALESEFNENLEPTTIKEAFPLKIATISLVGSSEVLLDQERDLSIRAKQFKIYFDTPLWRHLLVARNAYKDENGNIRGVEQYYSSKLYVINSFKTDYALRLYMGLLRYNGISKKFTWRELKELIGKKTQKANFKVQLKSHNSSKPRKSGDEAKEFENFKLKTLPGIFEEIRECTGLDYRYEARVGKEIAVIIHIPNRLDNLSLWEQFGFNSPNGDNVDGLEGKIEENASSNKIDSEPDGKDNVNEHNHFEVCDNKKSSNDDTLSWSADGFDWFSSLDAAERTLQKNSSAEHDEKVIKDLYSIFINGYKLDISLEEIKKIYIENNNDAKKTNKVLEDMRHKKNG